MTATCGSLSSSSSKPSSASRSWLKASDSLAAAAIAERTSPEMSAAGTGKSQHSLRDDVPLNLGRAAVDRGGPRIEIVSAPSAHFRAVVQLELPAQHLPGQVQDRLLGRGQQEL